MVNEEQLLGLIRHILTFGGGVLMARGVLTEGMVTDIVGAIMTLIGTSWSIISKK